MPASEPSRFQAAQPIYDRRIRAFAQKSARLLPSVEPQDIENELLEVLWKACNSYDPDQGARFNTHFWNCAQRRVIDLHKAASAQKRIGDYERVWLEDEAIRDAIGELLAYSPEDEVIALSEVREIIRVLAEEPDLE